MRTAPSLVLTTTMLSLLPALMPSAEPRSLAESSLGCRHTTPSDSALFLDYVQGYSSPIVTQGLRDASGLPLTPADSIRFVASDSLCDLVSQRFNEHWDAERGDTVAPRRQVLLVRVSANRYVGDPAAANAQGTQRLFITVDSLMNTVAVWGVTL